MFHLLWRKQCSRCIFRKDYSLRQNSKSELKRPKIKELYLKGLKPVLVFKKNNTSKRDKWFFGKQSYILDTTAGFWYVDWYLIYRKYHLLKIKNVLGIIKIYSLSLEYISIRNQESYSIMCNLEKYQLI